jgi:hypothetical protein
MFGLLWHPNVYLKVVPLHATEALAGERIYSSYSFSTRWEWVVSVTSRPRFSPGKRTPRYLLYRRLGWTQAGLDTETRGEILSLLPGIEPRSLGCPARSQALYWLSYPCSSDVYCLEIMSIQTSYILRFETQREIIDRLIYNAFRLQICSLTFLFRMFVRLTDSAVTAWWKSTVQLRFCTVKIVI